MDIGKLLDVGLLIEMIETGYVGVQQHPTEPLDIYNYTQKAQYDRLWNSVTMQCRGLIVERDTGEIVARPWPKFFNYGEHVADTELRANEGRLLPQVEKPVWSTTLDLDAAVTVRDKLDGSLGILYYAGDGYYSIATRGSFTSEQAIKGTELLRQKYRGFKPLPGITYLFEIIYPENRIVLDYGEEEKLVLLGIVETATGATDHGDIMWPGEFADFVFARTLREALELPPRENAEGVVVTYKDTGLKVKIKQDDYVALHKIVTGLNERVVWERIGAGEDIRDIVEPLPDEFALWAQTIAARLATEAEDILKRALDVYADIVDALRGFEPGTREYRKAFAAHTAEWPSIATYLFLIRDGRDVERAIWKTLKPAGRAPREFAEATA